MPKQRDGLFSYTAYMVFSLRIYFLARLRLGW